MVLKTENCSFSGLRVFPGHGTYSSWCFKIRAISIEDALRAHSPHLGVKMIEVLKNRLLLGFLTHVMF